MFNRFLLAAALLGLSTVASATTFLDTTPGAFGGLTMGTYPAPHQAEPIGQTFVLPSPTANLKAGGMVADVNRSASPSFDLTVGLFSGASVSGTMLDSQTFPLFSGFEGLWIVDFSALGTLAAGTYSIGFSSAGSRGLVRFAGTPSPNTDLIDSRGILRPDGRDMDLAVLVTNDPISPSRIPLPAGLSLLLSALACLGLAGATATSREDCRGAA